MAAGVQCGGSSGKSSEDGIRLFTCRADGSPELHLQLPESEDTDNILALQEGWLVGLGMPGAALLFQAESRLNIGGESMPI